jgi:electron transport complex protein RnfC
VDSGTVAALADAILYGLPPISSVVTVTGDAVARPADYRAPAGTTVGRLLEQADVVKPIGMVVAGGPLSGRALSHPDVVLDPVTSCLTLLSNEALRRRNPQACLRCGWCLDACPVGLDPAALMNLAERLAYDQIASQHPEVCLECGICSYVCPAQLDLARAARDLKRAHQAAVETAP